MDYENRDQEVSLKRMLYSILYRWREVLALTVVFAVLCGGIQGYRAWRTANDPEVVAQYELEYLTEVELYQKYQDSLESSIADLSESAEKQVKYLEESVLMQIDSYNACTASANLYVSTDYQILPGMAYQNVDETGTILACYRSALSGKTVIDEIARSVGMQTKYLKELVTVSVQENRILTISAYGTDCADAQRIVDLMLKYVDEIHAQIEGSVSNHTITLVTDTVGTNVDTALHDKQEREKETLERIEETLEQKREELEALEEPTTQVVSNIGAVKTAVKWGILGGVAGCILAVGIGCWAFLFGDKVYSGDELRSRFNLKVIGGFCAGKKHADWFCRRLKHGENRITENSEQNTQMLALNVCCYASGAKTVLMTGDAEAEEIENLTQQLHQKLSAPQIIACGSLLSDPAALELLTKCDGVLLVEEAGVSHYSRIAKELERISDADKPLVGCIFIEQ